MKRTFLIAFGFAFLAHQANSQPQCSQTVTQFGVGRGPAFPNRGGIPGAQACNSWALAYWTPTSASSISIEIDVANDAGGVPGSWSVIATVPTVGSNPSTTLSGLIIVPAYSPWVSVNVTVMGVPQNVTWTLTGASGITASKGVSGGANVFLSNLQSPTAIGQTLTFNNGIGNAISAGNNSIINGNGTNISGNGSIQAGGEFSTQNNCISASGTCGSAPAGFVTIAAAATTVTVSSTLVHTNSQFLLYDAPTQGAALGVTCNTTVPTSLTPTAVTNGTSFVITVNPAPVTNPLCVGFAFQN